MSNLSNGLYFIKQVRVQKQGLLKQMSL